MRRPWLHGLPKLKRRATSGGYTPLAQCKPAKGNTVLASSGTNGRRHLAQYARLISNLMPRAEMQGSQQMTHRRQNAFTLYIRIRVCSFQIYRKPMCILLYYLLTLIRGAAAALACSICGKASWRNRS